MLVIGLLFLILTLFCLKKTIQSFKSKKTIVTKIVLVIMTFFLGYWHFVSFLPEPFQVFFIRSF